jgi:hypothetical protein
MCSLVQKSLSSKDQYPRAKMLCGQLTGQKQTCTMSAKHHPPDYGLNTLMAPTAPLSFAALPPLDAARQIVVQQTQSASTGFLSAPFQPPRS